MHRTREPSPTPASDSIPLEERSDEDLMRRYAEIGDHLAYEQLVRRYERELFNYLRHYLSNAEMAEDAFQATFLRVHVKCRDFDPARRFRPWLYTIATNRAIDVRRHYGRHRMISLNAAMHTDADGEPVGSLDEVLGCLEAEPSRQAERAEIHRQLRHAVHELPPPLRDVLLLVYYQGFKYREAAAILQIPVGTAKSRLHAAIARLGQPLPPLSARGGGQSAGESPSRGSRSTLAGTTYGPAHRSPRGQGPSQLLQPSS